MNAFQAFILGMVQGLAEFLPISSSGHLLLVQKLFGITNDSLALEVLLHVGTLLAVLVVYWRRVLDMILHPIQSDLKWLILATIPATIAAFVFDFDAAFEGAFLGASFLLTALILVLADFVSRQHPKKHRSVTWKDALAMGIMQAVAILPGVSRSGSTVAGGVGMGLRKSRAADFSFMMSMPAILGSVILEGKDLFDGTAAAASGGALPLIVGVLSAAVFGFLAIRTMLFLIRRISLKWFSLYTALLGLLVLFDQLVTHRFF